MARSRDLSRSNDAVTRNLARLAAGALVVASPFALAGTANAATPGGPTAPSDKWDQVAQCESGGKWNTDTGNGFKGGLQFTPSTWRANGGKGDPSDASAGEQKRVAEKVLASQGWGAWPNCGKGGGSSKSSSSSGSSSSDSDSSDSDSGDSDSGDDD
jgi:resuscitation-promoting factor RpfA